MLKQIEERIDLENLKEDLRKIGVFFITGGIAGLFLNPIVSHGLSMWLSLLGCVIWCIGLIKRGRS